MSAGWKESSRLITIQLQFKPWSNDKKILKIKKIRIIIWVGPGGRWRPGSWIALGLRAYTAPASEKHFHFNQQERVADSQMEVACLKCGRFSAGRTKRKERQNEEKRGKATLFFLCDRFRKYDLLVIQNHPAVVANIAQQTGSILFL